MARVEVKGSLAGPWTHLNDLKIKGIYINNVKLTRGASSLTRIASAAWGTELEWLRLRVDKPMDITSSLSKIFLLLPQRKML